MSADDPNAASPPTNEGGFLGPHARAGPPSIISSRMTDIASEDGEEAESPSPKRTQRRSLATSESRSRPDTARTGASSRHHPQPLRKTHLSGLAQRRSGGSVASSVGRTPSTTSRSHVPSLTSNAFYRPMSSQKLQAQRGGTRASQQQQQPAKVEEAAGDGGDGGEASGLHGLTTPRTGQHVSDDGSYAPPSPGTEMTGPETIDRRTANTSPTTQGHRAQGSITDSVRPLQKRAEPRDLTVGVGGGYMDRAGSFSGIRSPRSFRSSFLMPRSDSAQNGSRRGLEGVEKLSSGASTPHHSSRQGTPRSRTTDPPTPSRVGRVFEYFEGNTVFCLGGRFQNARQRPVNVATGLFVVVPSVLFFAFSASDLWHEVSPAIPITFAYLVYICFSSFIHASVSDPGVSSPSLQFH